MIEESEHREGITPSAPAESSASAVAVAGASRGEADAYLRKQSSLGDEQIRLTIEQTALARLQAEDLRREDRLRHWSLRLHHVSALMKLAFELSVAFILLALAAGVAAAIWSAMHADGLVIEAFSVPPDLAARGLTGEVVATKMLDRLSDFQAQTDSSRAASSYANNWGRDIKVQIPDTGVSIGELNRDLHAWLGHETHITGAVYRSSRGVDITARAGGETSPVLTGKEQDLDGLIQKAAEAVYRATQPYRYAVYLDQHNRNAEAKAAYWQLIATGSQVDRAYAYSAISNDLPLETGNFAEARAMALRALALDPDLLLAQQNLVTEEQLQQHDEEALHAVRDAIAMGSRRRDPTMDADYFAVIMMQAKTYLAALLGDYGGALFYLHQMELVPDRGASAEDAREKMIGDCGRLHDLACFRNAWADLPPVPESSPARIGRIGNAQAGEAALDQWSKVTGAESWMTARLSAMGAVGRIFLGRFELPVVALAHAYEGEFGIAHAEIDRTPLDCVACLRARGTIDALQGNGNGAEYWFVRAVAAAPSVPLAYSDWGAMLLHKGDYDGAIAKFAIAHAKGPHFADPLEMWGEALMQKNRSDLALAKFEEANNYAPNWDRLHLEWGKALTYLGRRSEARQQFAIASHLDLSVADAAAVARWRAKHV